jgi:hypothetical protein
MTRCKSQIGLRFSFDMNECDSLVSIGLFRVQTCDRSR